MESVQCTHRTSFCVNYTSIFFKKTTTIILPFTISESQDFVRSTVEMFYFCSLILELPLGRQRLTQQLGPEPFGPRLVSNTAPSGQVFRVSAWAASPPAGCIPKPKSQDWQVEAMSCFMTLSWHSQSTISTIITNLSLIQRGKKHRHHHPWHPPEAVPKSPCKESMWTGRCHHIPKRKCILWFITKSEKTSFKEAMWLAHGHTIKKHDTKILKQACVTPNPVKLPLHYTCKTCCWNSAMLQWKSGHM